ncbi:hypothetical protein [Zhihengliuella flava]|uniref:Uncharacterized protein n=1 Tax=Zhihengliuella flava TaxID=1285193 RepID=A0A931GIG7_9MICC|nr:hypothetical protein [Zhihengliuella flava]MBG6084246.1 hypothetical protein [Zhihengliuella flava]
MAVNLRAPGPGRSSGTRRATRAGWASAAAVALLAASACGGPSGSDVPDDAVHSAATASPGGSGEASAESEAEVTIPRVAVTAGVLQASGLGFDLSSDARSEDLTALREDPADALEDVVVAPSACQDPLTQLNWSPTLLAGSVEDAALSQFTAEGVSAIGTVEVAKNDDPGQLQSHYEVVQRLLTECSSVTLNVTKPGEDGAVTPANGPLTFRTVETGYDVDSALFWSRFPNDEDLKQQSLVLIREAGDYVAMVSFIGPENIQDTEFRQMAESVLEVTVLELEAQQEG